ncbi:MAG TPA: DUF5668 domain-containing protein [Armatimonadota bacterium]|nr:DUF5668 domain-containing protein [Armatimonadota bacterium]
MSSPDTAPPPICARCQAPVTEASRVEHRGAIYCTNCVGRALNGERPTGKRLDLPALVHRAGRALDDVARLNQPGLRNPRLAVVLSLLPGLGQMYCGQMGRGVIVMVAFFALASTIPLLVVPLYFWNLFDAYWAAGADAQPRLPTAPSPAPPRSDVPPPLASTAQDWAPSPVSPAWGMLLIVLGVLFLLNNFGVRWLTWDRMWPAAMLALGIWLLVSFWLSRRAAAAPESVSPQPAPTSEPAPQEARHD